MKGLIKTLCIIIAVFYASSLFALKKCPKCGRTFSDAHIWCQYCGEKLVKVEEKKSETKKPEKKAPPPKPIIVKKWTRTFEGSKEDIGYWVEETRDGGYIISGSTCSFGSGDQDMWVIKTDSDGNVIWTQTFGAYLSEEYGRCVKQTKDGGYIIVGAVRTYKRVKIGKDYYREYEQEKVLMIKTDGDGNKIWSRIFGESGKGDFGQSVVVTPDDKFIVTGGHYSGSWDPQVLLISVDSEGNRVWSKILGIPHSGRTISATNDGGYIIANYPGNKLIKTDRNGNPIWTKDFDASCRAVRQTKDGGYIATGSKYIDTLNYFDLWVTKTDINGNPIWTKTFGGNCNDKGRSVDETKDGGFVVAGDKGDDLWLIKIDDNGNLQWEKTFGGSGNDEGYCVHQTKDGGYIICGKTNSYGGGDYDIWLIKTDAYGNTE